MFDGERLARAIAWNRIAIDVAPGESRALERRPSTAMASTFREPSSRVGPATVARTSREECETGITTPSMDSEAMGALAEIARLTRSGATGAGAGSIVDPSKDRTLLGTAQDDTRGAVTITGDLDCDWTHKVQATRRTIATSARDATTADLRRRSRPGWGADPEGVLVGLAGETRLVGSGDTRMSTSVVIVLR
jgi:hypothetical protein